MSVVIPIATLLFGAAAWAAQRLLVDVATSF
jgi:hypothetical protein